MEPIINNKTAVGPTASKENRKESVIKIGKICVLGFLDGSFLGWCTAIK